jgi:cyclopropane fatty-acyl-phospholipid synthase-like methyltransferase
MTNVAANPYDEVSYLGYPFPQTHPDRLATLATLFGMKPAPLNDCRVLEIGCGDGANLIPMALQLPGSQFVGVDLAAEPTARGRAMAEALRLGNVTLRHLDIRDLSAVEVFRGNKTASMSTNHPLTKTAVLELGRIWPRSLHFCDLLAAAHSRLSPSLSRRNGDIGRDDALRLGGFLV